MEVDRQALIKLLEAFVDTSEVLQREMMMYQGLFAAVCKMRGMTQEEIERTVQQVRPKISPGIDAHCQTEHQHLLEKLPQIVGLLDTDRDAALRVLREWNPTGLPN